MVVKLNPALTSGHAQKFSFGNSESNASHIRVNSPVAADAFVPTATATKRGIGAFARKMALAFMATCTTLGIGGCAKDEPVTPDTPSKMVTPEKVTTEFIDLKKTQYLGDAAAVKSTAQNGLLESVLIKYSTGEYGLSDNFKYPEKLGDSTITNRYVLMDGDGQVKDSGIIASVRNKEGSFTEYGIKGRDTVSMSLCTKNKQGLTTIKYLDNGLLLTYHPNTPRPRLVFVEYPSGGGGIDSLAHFKFANEKSGANALKSVQKALKKAYRVVR